MARIGSCWASWVKDQAEDAEGQKSALKLTKRLCLAGFALIGVLGAGLNGSSVRAEGLPQPVSDSAVLLTSEPLLLPSTTFASRSKDLPLSQAEMAIDPIESPFPVPWLWVTQHLSKAAQDKRPLDEVYRSALVVTPDGLYGAYSQINLRAEAEASQSQIGSLLFVQNLKTGKIQQVQLPALSLAEGRFSAGSIRMILPISWSKTGDRLLIRQFNALFASDIATDSALVWDRQSNQLSILLPKPVNYDTAVLLGWSTTHTDQVLFRTSILGETQEKLWAVNLQGQAITVDSDRPMVFGQRMLNSVEPKTPRSPE
jgi:hypothetical protein